MAQHSWVPRARTHRPRLQGVSLQVPVLTTRSTSPCAFFPGDPSRGPGNPPEPSALLPGSTGLTGSGLYLVIRGLLQHLRAQVGAELELPAPKIAPGQEQRIHLRAHGGSEKDQGPAQGGRGARSRRRPALPGNARGQGPCQRGASRLA